VDTDKIRRAIQGAPLLSTNASRLMQVMVAPDHTMADVVQIVKLDSVLTARLLRIVNSPVFDLLTPAKSVDRAVGYLGERIVVSVAMADSVAKMLNSPLTGYESRPGDLWRHDLFSAFAAREVAGYAKGKIDRDLAYTGGLLHDIGKAIISDFLLGTAERATTGIDRGEKNDYLAAEQEILGLDHTEVGYELARKWNLPDPLPQLIRHHHQPRAVDDDMRPLAYAVHLGDIIAMMAGYATGSDALQYQLDSSYEEYFILSCDGLGEIMLTVSEEFQQAEDSLAVA
jgi:putative nucleotidyltransferase with HDIG domain